MRLKSMIGVAWAAALILLVAWLVPASAQGPTEVKISMNEFSFKPASFTVPAGQPVRFTVTNDGKFPHNVTFELPGKNIEQTLFPQNLTAGQTQTAEYTFSTAGDWEIYCPVGNHEERGMKGTVTVTATSGQSAAASSSASGAAPAQLPVTGGTSTSTFLLLAAGLVVLVFGLSVQLVRSLTK